MTREDFSELQRIKDRQHIEGMEKFQAKGTNKDPDKDPEWEGICHVPRVIKG